MKLLIDFYFIFFLQANWSFWSRISKLFTSYESRGSVTQKSMEMELYWYM